MANLRSQPVQSTEAVKEKPQEYDYLDYEENEKKLEELRSNELQRYKDMIGRADTEPVVPNQEEIRQDLFGAQEVVEH